MSTNARRLAIAALGAAVVAVAAIVLTGGGDGYTIRAEFKDVGGLRKNSSVKVAGVPAGKVTDIEVTPRDTAIATLRIDNSAAPIGRGASVNVRPTDLLGERYAELSQGDTSKPMASGSLISIRRTGVPVELDDILNTLDPDTRTRLGILINELGVGLDGRGTDLNKLLATLPPSLQQTRALIDQVRSQNAALEQAIVKGDRITASVNGKRDDLGALIDQADGALATVAQKRHALGATIQNAPGGLAALRTTLGHLDTASVTLRPAAADLQRAASPLNETLRALPRFADEATPTLKTATSVAPQLTRLGQKATPTIRRLQPTAKALDDTLVPAQPALSHMTRRGTDDLLYFISNMTRGLQGRDGLSHFIGAKFYLNSEYVADAINAFNGYQPQSQRKARKHVELPRLPDVAKQVQDKVKEPVKKVQDEVSKLGDKVKKTADGVLGPAGGAPQVPEVKTPPPGGDAQRLFDYLMGG
jgi:virulence factor Mce-like protein